MIDRSVYGVPFHNSTPLLYINADKAKEAGLDPNKPPQTWAELTDWARSSPSARATGDPMGHRDPLRL